ncbi:hypothetical protein [Pseudaestuariivita rosea]|uniref:hypothetical protein n=1 Tax=Pseudaestuariivita rosea TaxID=2763263 RepID=UPI001ABB70CD|nr:hypothetical protein [Pseudaestuariivita rosea]
MLVNESGAMPNDKSVRVSEFLSECTKRQEVLTSEVAKPDGSAKPKAEENHKPAQPIRRKLFLAAACVTIFAISIYVVQQSSANSDLMTTFSAPATIETSQL